MLTAVNIVAVRLCIAASRPVGVLGKSFGHSDRSAFIAFESRPSVRSARIAGHDPAEPAPRSADRRIG